MLPRAVDEEHADAADSIMTLAVKSDALPIATIDDYAETVLEQKKDWNNKIIVYRDGAPIRVRDTGLARIGPRTRR